MDAPFGLAPRNDQYALVCDIVCLLEIQLVALVFEPGLNAADVEYVVSAVVGDVFAVMLGVWSFADAVGVAVDVAGTVAFALDLETPYCGHYSEMIA